MKELISIVIPVYNVEKYLKRCLNSIIKQTYSNIEIVLVDDGSTDSSGKICDEYAKIDSRIRVFHKVNGGLSDARNYGIKKIKGEYIGFVDSDDWISNQMYEKLFQLIKSNEADISICNYYRTDTEDLNKLKLINEKINLYDSRESIKQLIINKKIQDYAWNKLYKADLFQDVEYPVGRNMEDKGTTYKTFLKAKKIVSTNQIYYFYFDRPDSIVNQLNIKLVRDNLDLSLERYRYLKKIFMDMRELDSCLFRELIKWKYIAERKNNKEIDKLFEEKKYMETFTDKFVYSDVQTTLKYLLLMLRRKI